MPSPTHLWSGDWQRDSEAAAAARAHRGAQIPEPVEVAPAPSGGPSALDRAVAAFRGALGLVRTRAALAVALAVLLLAGAAYGLSALNSSVGSGSATAGQSAPWIGVQLESLPNGAVVIAAVMPHSPAASAGLRTGDVITEIEGRPVGAPVDVSEAVDALTPGQQVKIQVERGSASDTAVATVAARPSGSP
jgi:membrane-associated protease RseP (regulator of RpoE activity)